MNIRCGCGKRMAVSDALAGKSVQCPDCGERIFVQADRSPGAPGSAVASVQGPQSTSKYAAEPGQSFGVQAARFSLYAPIVAIVLNVCATGNKDRIGMVTIGVTNLILIVAGFVLGVVALISTRRYGGKGILGRAVAGVALNGLFLLSGLVLLIPLMQRSHLVTGLAGHWRMVSSPTPSAGTIDITFNRDGTFHMTASGGKPVDLTGRWEVSFGKVLGVHVSHVAAGDPGAAGRDLGLGRVTSNDQRQFVLATDHGDEVYQRIP